MKPLRRPDLFEPPPCLADWQPIPWTDFLPLLRPVRKSLTGQPGCW